MWALVDLPWAVRGLSVALVLSAASVALAHAASLTPRANHVAVALPSGRVLVAGGNDHLAGTLRSSQIYNETTQTWSTTGDLVVPRAQHQAVVLQSGKVLVAGGASSGSAELYDPASETWSATGSMADERVGHTLTLLNSGKVFVVGGFGPSDALVGGTEIYDPQTGVWTAAAPMSRARGDHSATLLPSGKVLIVGGTGLRPGIPSRYYPIEDCVVYDPVLDAWSPTTALAYGLTGHTATLLPSGRVLVAGGATQNFYVALAREYDPGSGEAWGDVGAMAGAMASHEAVRLLSGDVLVPNFRNGESSQVYDPLSKNWNVAGSLTFPRMSYSATLMSSGRVLVVGGVSTGANAGPQSLGSVEEFAPDTGTWSQPDLVFTDGFQVPAKQDVEVHP